MEKNSDSAEKKSFHILIVVTFGHMFSSEVFIYFFPVFLYHKNKS